MKVSPALLLTIVAVLITPGAVTAQPNEAAIVSHIRREAVDSSAIATIGYSKQLRALEIEFVNGAIYRYLEVPSSLYRELRTANSKARFYDKNIRGRYRSVHVRPRKRK